MAKPWTGSRLDLFIDLDVTGVARRRAALESALRAAITDGRLAPGTPLPSSRGLAAQLGFSRGTVTSAYGQLVDEGYLAAHPGSGTRVAPVPSDAVRPPDPAAPAARPRHDLRPGQPDVASFPVRGWLAATRRVFAAAGSDIFAAGDPQGRPELRAALAAYLGRTRGVRTSADLIVITDGYYQSVDLLTRVLLARGAAAVAAEDPGHDVYRALIRRSGLPVAALPVDDRGAQPDALGAGVAAAFLTPAHQYPTGVPLHRLRRRAFCTWARATGGLIVEDDYDGEFRYDRRPVGALQGIAPDHVVFCGSASKTLSPALRLGWMAVPRDLLDDVVRAKAEADLYTATPGQLVLADLIAGHAYERHIRAARLRYARRRELLLRRIAAFPALTAHGVPAGLHLMLTLPPDGPGEPAVSAACATRGLAIRGVSELHHTRGPHGLLLGFAAPPESGYPAALDALADALRAVLR